MLSVSVSSRLPVAAERVFDWHLQPDALPRLAEPFGAKVLHPPDSLHDGERAELLVPVGPFRVRWVAEHSGFQDRGADGGEFCDRQIRGPFRSWVHRHVVRSSGPMHCVLHDEVRFELPGGRPVEWLAGWLARGKIRSMMQQRHQIVARCVRRPGHEGDCT